MPEKAPRDRINKQRFFKEWGSFDSSANRQALKENDFSWLENFIQVGNANMQSLDGPSAVLASTSGGDTIYEQFDMNVGGADKIINICTNGSAYSFDTGTNAITKFATTKFDGGAEVAAQWQNNTVLFIGPTGGYWAWNGTTLIDLNTSFTVTGTTTGGNLLTVTASPSGFIISPGMTFTGAGLGTITILTYGTANGGNGTTNSANGTYNTTTTANVGSETITFTQIAPTAGTTIATFAGRVWIGNGRTITFSAPNSYTDFSVGDAGGAFTVQDESLYGSITAMIATNNYLFFGGIDSINVISDVRVGTTTTIVGGSSSTATVTLFSNTNISANVGIPFNAAVAGYLRTIVFMTKRGPYILAGASPQKMGPNLDGLVPLLDFTKPVVCGVAQVNLGSLLPGPAQNVVMWGASYKDPVNGPRFLFMCFFDGKWFLASALQATNPTVNLTYAVAGFNQATPCMYGTDGTNIYRLFVNDSNPPSGKIQTALWHEGDPTLDKQVMKIGIECNFQPSFLGFNTSVDNEVAQGSSFSLLVSTQPAIWLTAALAVSAWTTALGAASIWVGVSFGKIYADATQFGKYYGLTIMNTSSDVTVNGILSEYIFRARW